LNKFWKNGEKSMNTNCDYFHQIQGQLEVTNKDVCVFAVFKITKVGEELIHELEYELVFRDQQFWEEKMLPKLQKFFFNCLLPEIVDPRRKRSMPLRAINIDGEPVPKVQVKKTKARKKKVTITNTPQASTSNMIIDSDDDADFLEVDLDM